MRVILTMIALTSFTYGDFWPPQHVIVTTTYGAGFFAETLKVLSTILHFSKENLKTIEVDWSDEFFLYKTDPHENGWDLYFDPIHFSIDVPPGEVEISGAFYHEIHDFLCVDQWVNYDRHLPYRLKGHEVIQKYLKIKQPILDEVEQIFTQKMAECYCIGVHVRYGSDHSSEAPKGVPSLKEYIMEVQTLLRQQHPRPCRVYLATDSQYVVKVFQQFLPPGVLVTIDTCRTEYRDVPHLIYGNGDYWLAHKDEFHTKKPGFLGGKGVLIDALLLARCNILIHSTSNIATFVTFYNPMIPSIYLPKGQATWPCRYGL